MHYLERPLVHHSEHDYQREHQTVDLLSLVQLNLYKVTPKSAYYNSKKNPTGHM